MQQLEQILYIEITNDFLSQKAIQRRQVDCKRASGYVSRIFPLIIQKPEGKYKPMHIQ